MIRGEGPLNMVEILLPLQIDGERPTDMPRDGSSASAASTPMRSGTRVGCHEIAMRPIVRHVFPKQASDPKLKWSQIGPIISICVTIGACFMAFRFPCKTFTLRNSSSNLEPEMLVYILYMLCYICYTLCMLYMLHMLYTLYMLYIQYIYIYIYIYIYMV